MKVMVIVKATANSEAGAMPSAELLEGMTKYNDELVKSGIMLAGDGLQPSSKGKRVHFSGSKRSVVDGPFAETKEVLAGFNLIEAGSLEEAVRIAQEFPWTQYGCIEVRPVRDVGAVRQRVGA